MSDPKTTHRLLILLGDGADPEVFDHPCGANAKDIDMNNNTGEEVVLDCDTPLDVAPSVIRYIESQDTTVSLSGTIATTSFPTWRDWADAGSVKNVKILLDLPSAQNGGSWLVPAILSNFKMTSQNHAVVKFSATISGAGRRVWTDAA